MRPSGAAGRSAHICPAAHRIQYKPESKRRFVICAICLDGTGADAVSAAAAAAEETEESETEDGRAAAMIMETAATAAAAIRMETTAAEPAAAEPLTAAAAAPARTGPATGMDTIRDGMTRFPSPREAAAAAPAAAPVRLWKAKRKKIF